MFRSFLVACSILLAMPIAFFPVQSTAQTAEQTPAETVPQTGDRSSSEILIDILKDDTARAALIEQLETAGNVSATADPATAEADRTVAQQIVEEVTQVVGQAGQVVSRTTDEIARVTRLLGDIRFDNLSLSPKMVTLLLVAGAAILASILGKLALDLVIARNRITALITFRRQMTLIALYAGLRLLSLAVTLGAGYAVALWRSGGSDPSATEAIFLTAVLAFGLCRIALRIAITPDVEHEPSFSNLAPRAQEIMYRNLRRLAAALIFSFVFLLPLVREWIGFATVRPVRTLLATILLVMAILTLRRLAKVMDAAHDQSDFDGGAVDVMTRGLQRGWRAIWPPLAMFYVIYCWIVAVTRPNDLRDIVLGASIYSAAAVLLALVGLRLMRLAGRLELSLPKALDATVPDLARRIGTVGRMISAALAVALMVGALVTAIAAWGVIEPDRWMSDPLFQQVLWQIVSAVLMAALLALLWAVIASVVDQRLRSATLANAARSRTLLGLFRNAFTILIGVMGLMVVLSQLGIDIAPLLAGAGVIGLAIGFGSQKLVQDIITGVFIQMDNAINVGDVVGVAGITGSVERLNLRSVRLRTPDGAVHIVPFSSVDTVTNLTRDFAFHLAEVGIAYSASIPDAMQAMQDAFTKLRELPLGRDIIDDLDMQGVIALADSSVNLRARIKTLPGSQWAVGRAYSKLMKEEFDAAGIEIPFPHRQLMLPPDLPKLLGLDRPREDAARDVTPDSDPS